MLLLALALAGWSSADQELRIGLDESRSGLIPEAELAHVYVLELPAGVPSLTISADAYGADVDMAVYYGPELEELYYDISVDPYPLYATPDPRPGRYEIHVMNLLWQDLAYVLDVASWAPAAPRPEPGVSLPGDGLDVFTIGVNERRRGDLAADEIEHVYVLDLPAGVPRVTIALDAFGEDVDMAVWDVDREELLYYDISADPYPQHTLERPQAGRYEIEVLNMIGVHMQYVLQVTTAGGEPVVPPPVSAPPPRPAPSPPLDADARPALRSSVDVVAPGVEMTVAFADTPGNSTDWIGLHRLDASDRQHLRWRYTDGELSGRLVFTAPNEPGWYDFRLFEQNGYTLLARSAPFEVRPAVATPPPPPPPPTPPDPAHATPPTDALGALLLVDATVVQPSASVIVRFEHTPRTPQNWIGLFAVDAGDRQHLRWQYTGAGTSGQLAFSAPSEPGRYEFRLFERNGYTLVTTSPAFEVRASAPPPPPPATGPRVWLQARAFAPGVEMTVAFADTPGNSTDWIGLHRLDASDRQHLRWRYTDGELSGRLVFTAPNEPGWYDFRLFEQNGYTLLARSAPFEVR